MQLDAECSLNLLSYKFENIKVAGIISKYSAKKILIQLPDGLKPFVPKIIDSLKKRTNATFYVSADPCYGACDLAVDDAKIIGADLIIHYGHTPINIHTDVKVIHINVESKIPIEQIVNKALTIIKPYERIGLITNVQHAHKLQELKRKLELKGKTAYIGQAGGLAKIDGQILGCDYTTAEKIQDSVDAFLYIGGGYFHPLGVMIKTRKPVIVADPFLGTIKNLLEFKNKILGKRRAAITKLIASANIGIIVGLKHGQAKPELAEKIQKQLESKRKRTMILCIREITPNALDNFKDIAVFVNTACPRIGVDDHQNFSRPIIHVKEVEDMLAEKND